MMKKIFFFLIFFLLFSHFVVAERPDYSFNDSVFEFLPIYPDDLLVIRDLFIYQELTDFDRLTYEYYLQPEFYPHWFDNCNITYRDPDEERHHGVYGLNIYPSSFQIWKPDKGDVVDLVALMYTSWGVEVKQGTVLKVVYDELLFDVDVINPVNNAIVDFLNISIPKNERLLLFDPTYPQFGVNWSDKILLRVKVKDVIYEDETIKIYNSLVPDEVDEYWWDLYGYDYVAGSSELDDMVPRAVINVKSQSYDDFISGDDTSDGIPYLVIGIFIIAVLIIISIAVLKKR